MSRLAVLRRQGVAAAFRAAAFTGIGPPDGTGVRVEPAQSVPARFATAGRLWLPAVNRSPWSFAPSTTHRVAPRSWRADRRDARNCDALLDLVGARPSDAASISQTRAYDLKLSGQRNRSAPSDCSCRRGDLSGARGRGQAAEASRAAPIDFPSATAASCRTGR